METFAADGGVHSVGFFFVIVHLQDWRLLTGSPWPQGGHNV
jgi:hypothetical protein